MSLVESRTEDDGLIVKIYYDDSPESPRDMDNVGTFFFASRSRYLAPDGDENTFDPNYVSGEEAYKEMIGERQARVVLPVYVYEHSGIMYRTAPFSCPWDSGQVGWIYATANDIREAMMVKRITAATEERVREILTSEVEVYSYYANGEVYGYSIEDKAGDEVGACWGYYGSDDLESALEEALKEARADVARETTERQFWLEREVVTV